MIIGEQFVHCRHHVFAQFVLNMLNTLNTPIFVCIIQIYSEVKFNWLLLVVVCVHNVVQYRHNNVILLVLLVIKAPMVDKIYYAPLVSELNCNAINTIIFFCYPK